MATASKTKRAKRITGLGVAATALGVTRQHLGLVLHGNRESKPLVRRYRAWKKDQRAKKLLARTDAHLATLQQNIPAMRCALRQHTANKSAKA